MRRPAEIRPAQTAFRVAEGRGRIHTPPVARKASKLAAYRPLNLLVFRTIFDLFLGDFAHGLRASTLDADFGNEMTEPLSQSPYLSRDQADLFAGHAPTWWSEDGAFAPLHRITPIRMGFIRDHLCAHFGRDPKAVRPLAGLSAIDIGCGGGLICEPLARLGARVTGIDAVAANIAAARAHADEAGLKIAYEVAAPEEAAARGEAYDIVINLEVIEHVSDPESFMSAACALVAPQGAMAASTINRTVKSLALGKVAAEYVLRWVPAGTHDWRKFVKPSELARHVRAGGLTLTALSGMAYDPIKGDWKLGDDLAVNYLAFAVRT